MAIFKNNGPGCAASGCGCSGGGSTSPGFSTCCTTTTVPATISLTFAFRSGTNAATYSNALQNTTLTYYPPGPAPAWAGGTSSGRYYSPVITDSFGTQYVYDISCNSGSFSFGLGQPGFTPGFTCAFFGTYTCSPFLLTDMIRNNNFCSLGYGTGTDSMTAS